MVDSGRNLHLKPLGLPDPRGFSPHLRSVMLDQKTFRSFRSTKADFEGERKWIIHDLLHILFYDYAFLNLGDVAFTDAHRFFEVHLASEAFAVLSLDYHVLSEMPGEGLAVEFDKSSWSKFQSLCPQLPHYLSMDFIPLITDLYLTGHSVLNKKPEMKHNKANKNNEQTRKEFDTWVGHEIRYAEKQRLYVAQWRADLENKSFNGKIPALEDSYVSEAVGELLSLILGEKKIWSEYLERVSVVSENKNYFAKLSKYQNLKQRDYRFTDYRSLETSIWQKDLEKIADPNPSQLFLFWQIASSIDSWQEKHMKLFGDLHQSTNTPKPNVDLWKLTQEILITSLKRIEILPPNPTLKSCFFLP